MEKIKRATAIKQKIKNGEHIGLLGKYIMYFLETFNIVGSTESPGTVDQVWAGTQAEYDALTEIRNDTLYFIT